MLCNSLDERVDGFFLNLDPGVPFVPAEGIVFSEFQFRLGR